MFLQFFDRYYALAFPLGLLVGLAFVLRYMAWWKPVWPQRQGELFLLFVAGFSSPIWGPILFVALSSL